MDIICQKTSVGMDESVDEHMWDVTVPGISGSFNSSEDFVAFTPRFDGDEPLRIASRAKLGELGLDVQTTLSLKYDYGSTSFYQITLVSIEEVNNQEATAFPREKPVEAPAGLDAFSTDESIDLNSMFPTFNTFLQQAERLSINLFQPGRKKNYGYVVERDNKGCKHMIYLPAKPQSKELSDYLHMFNYAAQFKYAQSYEEFPDYTWYSMVVFPHDYNKSFGKYGQNLEPGFCDMKIAPVNPGAPPLNTVFPKVAALAGYKKDKKVPKGWITYKNGFLRVCSGAPKTVKCNAPDGTAFHGEDQHEPASPEAVLFQAKVKIQSLHHLFCVVEGLLRTC